MSEAEEDLTSYTVLRKAEDGDEMFLDEVDAKGPIEAVYVALDDIVGNERAIQKGLKTALFHIVVDDDETRYTAEDLQEMVNP
jgi:hypothetical protein